MPENPEVEIDVQSVAALIEKHEPQEFLLLDCREPAEYETCQIAGSTLIPMQQIPERLAEIESWKERPLVVHCHHGGRSLRVVQFLRQNGFPQAQNMTGGIDVWSQQVDPEVPRY